MGTRCRFPHAGNGGIEDRFGGWSNRRAPFLPEAGCPLLDCPRFSAWRLVCYGVILNTVPLLCRPPKRVVP